MTWLATSSPTCWAALAPASTAARTLPTSPCTTVATKALPMLIRLRIFTLAALAIASVASTRPTSPLVSRIPIAVFMVTPVEKLKRSCWEKVSATLAQTAGGKTIPRSS